MVHVKLEPTRKILFNQTEIRKHVWICRIFERWTPPNFLFLWSRARFCHLSLCLSTVEIANFPQETAGRRGELLIEFTLPMSMTGETAVAYFHSVTNMINGLNGSVLVPFHHLHQVLKSLHWGRKHQDWLKEEEEHVWRGLKGVPAMFHHLHTDLNQDPYSRNQSDF